MEAKRKKLEFPDSGKIVHIPPVSMPGIAMRLQRQYPQPRPPRNQVDYGDGVKKWEFNYSDPDFQQALRMWGLYVDEQSRFIALNKVYAISLTKEQQAEIDQWKKDNPDGWDAALDSDAALWIENIAITTQADFEYLINAIGGVDEQAVESLQDNFQGDV